MGTGWGMDILFLFKVCATVQISKSYRKKKQEEICPQLILRCALGNKKMVSSLQSMLRCLTINSSSRKIPQIPGLYSALGEVDADGVG